MCSPSFFAGRREPNDGRRFPPPNDEPRDDEPPNEGRRDCDGYNSPTVSGCRNFFSPFPAVVRGRDENEDEAAGRRAGRSDGLRSDEVRPRGPDGFLLNIFYKMHRKNDGEPKKITLKNLNKVFQTIMDQGSQEHNYSVMMH
jgi:hypothetical protein